MTGDEAVARARMLFLNDSHTYGCAETTFVVLKEAFGLPKSADSSAAVALNGGIAYGGGVCGAISGAALAGGLLAAHFLPDHQAAKGTARGIIAQLMDDFQQAFGALDCRELLGRDIRTPQEHQAFLDSDVWREVCMGQIEFSVRTLAALPDDPMWGRAAPTSSP